MKIYLDNSFLNRPFDEPSLGWNRLEADALFLILERIKKNQFHLVGSPVIGYENSFNPAPERKKFVDEIMKMSTAHINLDEAIRRRAMNIQKASKLHALDALHVACAEAAGVDFFITCDYAVIKRCQGHIKVVSPLEFIHEYEKYHPA